MTMRLKGVTVAFQQDIREDDAQAIINAIKMIKGVLEVSPVDNDNSANDWIIETRIRNEYEQKIYNALKK